MLRIISIRMSHRNVRVLPFILGLMIFLTGCNLPVRGMPSLDETQIVVAVQLTQIAAQSAQGRLRRRFGTSHDQRSSNSY